MAQFQRHFVQELTKPLIVCQCGDLGFSGDNLSDVISVDLYTDGVAYSGGGTCAGACICPDGSTVALTGSVSGKTASVTLTEDCFAIPGQIGIAIRVTSGTTKTTVLKAIYNVEQFSTNNPVDPGSRITLDVGTLISQIDAAVESIPASADQLKAAMAPNFSDTTAYPAGAYVWNNGTLYKFTTAHAAGSWIGTDATAVALGNDVSDLKIAVDDIVDGRAEQYADIVMTSGAYIKNGNVTEVNLTPVPDNTSQYAVLDCSPGDTFVLDGVKSYNSARAWVFIDNQNMVLLPVGAVGTLSETITAPTGAVKVTFNDIYPSTGTIKKYVPARDGLVQIEQTLSENTSDISNLKTDAENAEVCINHLSVDNVGFYLVDNAYVNGDTGAFTPYTSSPAWSRTDYISVDDTVNLIINITRQGGDNAFYDASKNWVAKIQLYVGENKIAVPANAKYAAFSSRTADMQNLTIQREYIGQAICENETAYNADLMYGLTDFGTIYNVGKGKTYETINAAITAWATADYPYATIFIDPGEYKEAVTIESGHQINLIGSGIDSTIIHTTSGNYVDAPITIFHGTVTVKNMTLIADHTENPEFDHEQPQYLKAYGIHIDHGSVGGVVTVENCKIVSYQAPAVGIGTIPNSKIRLINCECYSYTAYTSDTSTHQYYQLHNGAILWHTSNAEDYPVRGNESFEMINVKAYNKNDYCVLRLVNNQDGETMPLLSINTTLVKGIETWQNPILGTPTPVAGSKYNNYSKLDY